MAVGRLDVQVVRAAGGRLASVVRTCVYHYVKTCILVTGIDDLWSRAKRRYRSSVTNERTKVTGNCPLLITRICNGDLTKTVTRCSYRSS
jgi:hypothetical protein